MKKKKERSKTKHDRAVTTIVATMKQIKWHKKLTLILHVKDETFHSPNVMHKQQGIAHWLLEHYEGLI